jgi:hypothetical protein
LSNPAREIPPEPLVYEIPTVVSPQKPTAQYLAIIAEQANELQELQRAILQTHLQYCLRLQRSFKDLQPIEFETVPLTDEQRQFKVDRVFASFGEMFIVKGLTWSNKPGDYCVWYCAQSTSPQPTHTGDEAVRRIHFKPQDIVKKGKVVNTVPGIAVLELVWQ